MFSKTFVNDPFKKFHNCTNRVLFQVFFHNNIYRTNITATEHTLKLKILIYLPMANRKILNRQNYFACSWSAKMGH